MTYKNLSARKRRVFDSVFTTPNISLPTPYATPATGYVPPGQVWGGPSPRAAGLNLQSPGRGLTVPSEGTLTGVDQHVEDQVRWDRAWHLVTHALLLPDYKADTIEREALRPDPDTLDGKFYSALKLISNPTTYLPLARQTESLTEWFMSQIRHNFLHQVLPIILRLKERYVKEPLLGRSLTVLELANRQYLHGMGVLADGFKRAGGVQEVITNKFKRDLSAMITNSVMEPLGEALRCVLKKQVFKILGIPTKDRPSDSKVPMIKPESQKTEALRRELLGLADAMRRVGLAGGRFQVIFAEIMSEAINSHVNRGYKGVWSATPRGSTGSSPERGSLFNVPRSAQYGSPSRCVNEIREWIENRYSKLAVQVLDRVGAKGAVTWGDMESYKDMCIGHLADLRINELFDIVASWPHCSGALDDLRTAITTPQKRLRLTEVFAKTVQNKLLHPGASTLKILQTYISMIWSFHSLDHSKVLLDRVAYPLQVYLCSREDTVRIIITGLLAEIEQENAPTKNSDKLVELAYLLNKSPEEAGQGTKDDELDWHDMDWQPDPVDAGPGYKRSKSADIIGTLIGVLGAQEVFIKEFQNIIGEHFLRQGGEFEKETKVLELLKLRFGESPLQACEVMLRDVQESIDVNTIILVRKGMYVVDTSGLEPDEEELLLQANSTEVNTKILSRLFWPSLNDERFLIPPPISELLQTYEKGFEEIKSARKLTWLPALGQATVELELADRKFCEQVHTWQAAVIYAFNDDGSGETVSKTATQLEDELQMDEDLIDSALRFWTQKLIIHESTPGLFSVLETLNKFDLERSAAQTLLSAHHTPHPGGSEDSSLGSRKGAGKTGIEKENSDKLGIYWSFVQGMLTNSSKEMQAPQIGMMLKMLIVDGFPFSNEELGEWLGGKVQEGVLEVNAGKYRLKR